ncbi:MAG: tRNA (adenosine(37)-N6)-threonylcarbamoyltransferase complex transferase subunit TsaD [Bacteroidales bacterium]|nr:tRNA (adenosine(37)-N6)-threonylcarbamoyltransferase complex transferase subunit TsaD [Bacteroidales bacterium]
MNNQNIFILGIESSCDDTSAAVLNRTQVMSNLIASQKIHSAFGGVVPELASRAHQQNIIPVVDQALKEAGIQKEQLNAVAFTRGPGLLGSLLVGISFAKAFAMGLHIPLIEVDHLQAHILSHFVNSETKTPPQFPFLCLTVSGGHTQIVLVRDYFDMEIVGQTIDDAAGETFDKAAKMMELPYPGGPAIGKLAALGNPEAFTFSKPNIPNFDYSFSGLKTSILYTLRDHLKEDSDFIEKNKPDICASVQKSIVDILMKQFMKAVQKYRVQDIAISGGVSANGALRDAVQTFGQKKGLNVHIPPFAFTTDNAAMIAVVGYLKFQKNLFTDQSAKPYSGQKI